MINILSEKECLFLRELSTLLSKYEVYIRGDRSVGVYVYVMPEDKTELQDTVEVTPIHFDSSFGGKEIEQLFELMHERLQMIDANREGKVYEW